MLKMLLLHKTKLAMLQVLLKVIKVNFWNHKCREKHLGLKFLFVVDDIISFRVFKAFTVKRSLVVVLAKSATAVLCLQNSLASKTKLCHNIRSNFKNNCKPAIQFDFVKLLLLCETIQEYDSFKYNPYLAQKLVA